MIHFYQCQKCQIAELELDVTLATMNSQECPHCHESLKRLYLPQKKNLRMRTPMRHQAAQQDAIGEAVYGPKGEARDLIDQRLASGELAQDSHDIPQDEMWTP